MSKSHSKETNCVHNGREYQGVNTPIFPSTSNRYIGYDENVYPRYLNTENQKVIVEILCKLEKAETGLLFSSGMAAISTTLFSLLKPGDHIILSEEIYGGTHKFIVEEFTRFGIEYDFIQVDHMDQLAQKIKSNTKAIYVETPSNPFLRIIDLKEVATLAKANNLISIADNTFASPINQNPIEYGIDVVVHSGTKYLGGHSDLSFGAVLTSNDIKKQIYKSALNFGGNLNPLDCYLIERSLKTLAVRVEKQNHNALIIAEHLSANANVSKVYYPGLKHHPNHELAAAQMNGFGGMLSFELVNASSTELFLKSLKLIIPSLSLGGVETIICQPSKTSHVKMAEEDRLKLGITDGLLRLSVGIENPNDLIEDLDAALKESNLQK